MRRGQIALCRLSAAAVTASPIEGLLRRDRLISAAGIGVLCALAWLYLVSRAGLGMSLADMTQAGCSRTR